VPPKQYIACYSWKPNLPDKHDIIFVPEPTTEDLPNSVDLQSGCLEVYNQGYISLCTANAIAAAFEFDLLKQDLLDFIPLYLFIYYNKQDTEGYIVFDSGSYICDSIISINMQGVCSENNWLYNRTYANSDKSWPDNALAGQQPTDKYYTEALKSKSLKYQYIKQDISDMKMCLVQGYPFVASFTVYKSFDSQEVKETGFVPMPQEGKQVHRGHTILVVGYNDNQNVWLVHNSWGPGWGIKGYCWFLYKYSTDPSLSRDF
jgi:C1A family cysteine protease